MFDLGVISVAVQLLLILVLMALFSGRRHLRSHRRRYDNDGQHRPDPARPASRPSEAGAGPRTQPPPPRDGLRSDDLLPACFADTCADWAPRGGSRTAAAAARTDPRVEAIDLDPPLHCSALDLPFEDGVAVRRRRSADAVSSLSCTIGRPVHMHA